MYIQPPSTIFRKEPLNKTTYEPPRLDSSGWLYLSGPPPFLPLVSFVSILRRPKGPLAMKIREIRHHAIRLYLLTLPLSFLKPNYHLQDIYSIMYQIDYVYSIIILFLLIKD